MTPAWSHLLDASLAAGIAAAAFYFMFRLFASTEMARRAQMTEFVKILTDQIVKRQDEQTAAINGLRDAVISMRDEFRRRD